MGGRNDGKSISRGVEMNLYDAHSPGRLFPIGIPKPNPVYKRGTINSGNWEQTLDYIVMLDPHN